MSKNHDIDSTRQVVLRARNAGLGVKPGLVLAILQELEETRARHRKAWGRAEAAEAAVQRVRDAIRDAPTSDPTSGRTGPPDDWPDDGELIGQGEFLVAEQVRRALDGGEQE